MRLGALSVSQLSWEMVTLNLETCRTDTGEMGCEPRLVDPKAMFSPLGSVFVTDSCSGWAVVQLRPALS